MTRQARSRSHHGHKGNVGTRKEYGTKNRTRDFDQVVDDVADPSRVVPLTEFDEDLPGGGQFYCVECAKYCIDADALERHKGSGPHKRMFAI